MSRVPAPSPSFPLPAPWWREGDLAEPVVWREGDVRGFVLPGYESLSLQAVPWERLRRETLAEWRLIKKASMRRVVRAERTVAGAIAGPLPGYPARLSGGTSAGPPEILYFKWVQIVGPLKILGGAFRSSKAAREFLLARRLLAAGLLTPTPLLVAERRRGPFLRDAWIVTRGIDPEWASVRELWRAHHKAGNPAGAAHRLAEDAGRALRAFHDRGLYFADSRAHHWFTLRDADDRDNPGTIFRRWAVIDLDASRLGRPPSPSARRSLLAMLLASFSFRRWTPDDSRRLLAHYYDEHECPATVRDDILRRARHIRERKRRSGLIESVR